MSMSPGFLNLLTDNNPVVVFTIDIWFRECMVPLWVEQRRSSGSGRRHGPIIQRMD